MGTVLVKIKLMPSSPDDELENIKNSAEKIITNKQGKNFSAEFQDIAFGLRAVVVSFAWPEEKELEEIENALNEIKHVVSSRVVDMRRAFG